MRRFISAKELAELHLISNNNEASLRSAARKGLLPAVKFGRRWLFDVDMIAKWADAGGTMAAGPNGAEAPVAAERRA